MILIGTKLVTRVPHKVDCDDAGRERYAEVGDAAEVAGHYPDSQENPFAVLFPSSGAWGFYSEAEIQQYFS